MNFSVRHLIGSAALLSALHLLGADTPGANEAGAPARVAAPLFGDPVLARGQGFEVRQSQIDEMYTAFRANRSALGQPVPPSARPQIEAEMLEKIIATQLCLQRATENDRREGAKLADLFVEEQKRQAPSESSFARRLISLGLTVEQFTQQVREQAIVKAVLDRELKTDITVTDAEARKYYDDNPQLFEKPEIVRVAHILLSTVDENTGQRISEEAVTQKNRLAHRLLERARAGEDFTTLIREYSEDANAKSRAGEYTIMRNDTRFVLSPEFEGSAFSLQPGQISDVVTSRHGFHVLKCLEKLPPAKAPFEEVAGKIKENLILEGVEKALPAYIERLKREAEVVILNQADK